MENIPVDARGPRRGASMALIKGWLEGIGGGSDETVIYPDGSGRNLNLYKY